MEEYERDRLYDVILNKLNTQETPCSDRRSIGTWERYMKIVGAALAHADEDVLALLADDGTRIEIDSLGMMRMFNRDNVMLGKFEMIE